MTAESVGSALPSSLLNGLVLLLGLAALFCGPLGGGLFVLLSLGERQSVDALSLTIGLSAAILGFGFGLALGWAGYQGLKRRRSWPFQPRMRWFFTCVAGSLFALVVGQLIISLGRSALWAFPLFHVMAMALPAIAVLLLAARGLKGTSRPSTPRQIIGEISLGAFGITSVGLTLELVAGVMLLIVGLILTPDGLAQLTTLQALLSDPLFLQDIQALADWVMKPWILVPLILMLVVIAPLIEEGLKGLGVPLLALWTGETPSSTQGWLWGMAVGAGFAIAEGTFNSMGGLGFWVMMALARAGATLMHVVSAGLTGMGWSGTLASRRPWPLLRGYLAGVTVHALWNGLVALIAISSVWMMVRADDPVGTTLGGLGTVAGLAGLLLLTVAIIAVLVYVTLRIRPQSG